MSKFFALIFLFIVTLSVNAQTKTIPPPGTQPYGKVPIEDLEMKVCDFEKDANAEVLFDVADAFYNSEDVEVDHHIRIKIFNDKGSHAADVRIVYYSIYNYQHISGLEAETINLNKGKIEITKVDKNLITIQRVDNVRTAIVFAFPNARPGCIVEFKYRLISGFLNFPTWYFQTDVPERFNQITSSIPNFLKYNVQLHTNQPFLKNTLKDAAGNLNVQVYAMANVLSFNHEPFMRSTADNIQSVSYEINGVEGATYNYRNLFDSWDKVGEYLRLNHYFGYEMNASLSGEKDILQKAKLLTTRDQKIAYIFNEVKNAMRWDGINTWYTNTGVSSAWQLKAGNSTEINLILQSLLTSAGVGCYPFMVSTREHGKINPKYPDVFNFDKTVVYVWADNGSGYILDASNKYNLYNEIPYDLLNSFGLLVDIEHTRSNIIYLDNKKPVNEAVFINAEIKPDGTMEGLAQRSSFSYLKESIIESYNKEGEKKYRELLKNNNNSLSIVDLKLENLAIDSLPLKQNITFKMELTGSGDDYIYFNPNIFSSFKQNPFLGEKRQTEIDFGYLKNNSIVGIFKLPAGYKAETLPKNISMEMTDKGISFKRIIAQQDGMISVRYLIDYQKPIFLKEGYPEIKEFYKKMYELLNEQIVLKKS